MRMVLDTAQTGSEIQIWIEVRLCELGSDHAARVAGNGENDGLGAPVPALGYRLRTTPTRSGGVAIVVVQDAALAFAAPTDEYFTAFKEDIFENELAAWFTDSALWPHRRTSDVFDDWFEVTYHSMLLDL